MRIIFMGTPEFAVPSLDILVKGGYDVVGVVTAPDKPAGRGRKLQESAVKQYAKEAGLNILQPANLKSGEFLEELKNLNADLQVVVAFRMLPKAVWDMPPKDTFNLHASLLPQYRGAAPINWAIINGEKETGATTFFLDEQIDTGKIIFQEKVEILPDETAGMLHDKLMATGAELVLKTVKAIEKGSCPEHPQEEPRHLKHAPKIFREDCRINWEKPVDQVYNFIRGLSPYPAAWTILENKTFKIYKAQIELIDHNVQPGTVISDNRTFMKIAAPGGWLALREVQLEGRKRMEIAEFLKGFDTEGATDHRL